MQWQPSHLASFCSLSSEPLQQRGRGTPGIGRRRIEPSQIVRRKAHRAQLEKQARQLSTENFRRVTFGAAQQVFLGIETNDMTRADAAGAAGTLFRGSLADPDNLDRRKSGPRRVFRLPGETGINDDSDAFNRE
jgi:hypothetical protein